eukprot:2554320-Rhodomonas_salina.4
MTSKMWLILTSDRASEALISRLICSVTELPPPRMRLPFSLHAQQQRCQTPETVSQAKHITDLRSYPRGICTQEGNKSPRRKDVDPASLLLPAILFLFVEIAQLVEHDGRHLLVAHCVLALGDARERVVHDRNQGIHADHGHKHDQTKKEQVRQVGQRAAAPGLQRGPQLVHLESQQHRHDKGSPNAVRSPEENVAARAVWVGRVGAIRISSSPLSRATLPIDILHGPPCSLDVSSSFLLRDNVAVQTVKPAREGDQED